LIAALTVRARAQTSYWHDSERLWHYVLSNTPDNYVACNNLGLVFDEKGQVEAAIAVYDRALQVQPAYAEAHNNLGNALCRVGRVHEAIAHYQKALELVPGLPKFTTISGPLSGKTDNWSRR
jgi:Tfp pilus assembly protein PilF